MFILPTLSKVCAAGGKYDRVSVAAAKIVHEAAQTLTCDGNLVMCNCQRRSNTEGIIAKEEVIKEQSVCRSLPDKFRYYLFLFRHHSQEQPLPPYLPDRQLRKLFPELSLLCGSFCGKVFPNNDLQ